MQARFSRSTLLIAAFMAPFVLLPKTVKAAGTYFLQSKCQSKCVYSVTAKIQLDGTVKPSADKKIAPLPITVEGQFRYDEMLLGESDLPDRRSVRYYHEAAASIDVDKHKNSPILREDMRLIAVKADKTGVSISSPHGPLTREELDLIDIPGSTLLLDDLLPNGEQKIGGSWKIADAALARLVCVDSVSRNGVNCELNSVNDSSAEIKIAGELDAAVAGVSTEIQLDGDATFDLKQKCLTSIQLRIKERRSVGYIGPGMNVTARLDVRIKPLDTSEQLTPAIVKEATETDPAASPLELRSEMGGFHLVYDRRWHITRNQTALIVMRLIDRGELVAQCNINPLPRVEEGKSVSIEDFQAEVKKSLGKRFDHFDTVAEGKGAGRMKMLKVIASGTVSDIAIQWRYYLAIAPDGRRLAMSYTMENDLVERFADADTAMTESIEFEEADRTPGTDAATTESEKTVSQVHDAREDEKRGDAKQVNRGK